jgi:hypothetical protein
LVGTGLLNHPAQKQLKKMIGEACTGLFGNINIGGLVQGIMNSSLDVSLFR